MITTFNMTNSPEDRMRFSNMQDLRQMCKHYGCDGIEYMNLIQEEDDIPKDLIQGVHLSSFPNWVDLWRGNQTALLQEFGTMEVVEQFYGGSKPEALIQRFRKELDHAQRIGAKYVVFHVTEVKIAEVFSYQFAYTEEEVIDAAIELIHQLLDGQGYTFDFLMENLWWPGLNFLNPAMTKRLIEGVDYPQKGFMLDTGHLLCSNQSIRTQEEGLQYINHILDTQEEWIPWMKGIHLHQSLSGAYAASMRGKGDFQKEEYWERWGQIFAHIFKVDQHRPFTCQGVKALIERVNPQYLTYEFITRDRGELEGFLAAQMEALI